MTSLLAEALRQFTDGQTGDSPYVTPINGLVVLRSDHAKPPAHLISKPALCIVAQGSKWTSFGDKRFEYHAGRAMVVSVETPSIGRVTGASAEEPFLGAVLEFDMAMIRDVMLGMQTTPADAGGSNVGAFLIDFSGPLADSVLRLMALLNTPAAIATLAPMTMREIYYWLLSGPQGGAVARMAFDHAHPNRVINAIHSLRDRYTQTLRIADLAAIASLSPSAFHRQFKAVTALTPLQYQKQLRLLAARRLLVSGEANVERAAFSVGYESPSQFSREYSRMFGASPKRDAMTIRVLPELG